MECLKQTFLTVGRNFLPVFGFYFARCLTSHTNRLQLTTLSRTVQCTPRLRVQLREDTGLSPAEAVFGAPIVLQNEFSQNDELSVNSIIKIFSKILHVLASSLPRHNYSTELPSELPAELLTAHLVWGPSGWRHSTTSAALPQPLRGSSPWPRSFTIRVRSRDEVVAISRLKACTAADATPGSPRCRGRPPGSRPGGPAAAKRVSFSDPLVSSASSSPVPPQKGPGTIFLPGEEVFACHARLHSLHRRSTRPFTGTVQEIRPLTSSPSSRSQSSGGALWRTFYTSGDHQTSRVYLTTIRLCYKTSNYKTQNYKTQNFKTLNCKTPNCITSNYKTLNLTERRILQTSKNKTSYLTESRNTKRRQYKTSKMTWLGW